MYSVRKKLSCKQFVTTLSVAALVAFLMVLINDAWIVVYIENQNQKLTEADSDLAREAEVSDGTIQTNLAKQIQKTESNLTARISELEENHLAQVRAMEEALNTTEEKLINATVMILELEDKHIAAFEMMREVLRETEGRLAAATDQISVLEDSHSAALQAMERELNTTIEQLQYATQRIAELESNLDLTNDNVDSLNTTKASGEDVSELRESLTELEQETASKIELDTLSTNLTALAEASSRADKEIQQELDRLANTSLNQTHRDELQEFIAMFESTKANQSDLEEVALRVTTLENETVTITEQLHQTTADVEQVRVEFQDDIDDLTLTVTAVAANTTQSLEAKADQTDLDSLSAQLAQLATLSVQRQEFQSLSANLTLLREETERNELELWAEIEYLSDGTINQTHHNALQDIVNMFAAKKANQSDLEALEAKFNTLSSTTDGMQSSIDELTQTVSSLESNVQDNSELLATKASEQALNEVTASLGEKEEEIEALKATVNSKADKTDVEDLQEEERDLDERVTTYMSSSQRTHSQLSSNITANDNDIERNKARISVVEGSIGQLETQVSGSPLPGATWLNIIICMSVVMLIIIIQ